jgi:L-malate glycosyltransferase
MQQTASPFSVLHLIKSLGRGGAETLLPEGLRFAERDRFGFSYGYFLPWKDALVPALREQDAQVTCFGGRNNVAILLTARRVAAHVKRHRIALIHCHLPIAGAVGRLAGRLAGVPVVYTEHNKQERYNPITRHLNRLTWGMQAQAIAVSADVAESIRAHIDSTVPLDVVLNGVDVERFRRVAADGAEIRQRYRIPPDAPVISTVAVFRVQKRLEDWVRAARVIRDRHPGARFFLVGDGPLRKEVEEAVTAHGMTDVIHLPGLQEDVRPYLSATDVYLMSSIFEGLPIALLEAMSMGCAPVCTAVGGIPEAIRSGVNGILSPPEQPLELGSAVADLLDEPERVRALGDRARSTVV